MNLTDKLNIANQTVKKQNLPMMPSLPGLTRQSMLKLMLIDRCNSKSKWIPGSSPEMTSEDSFKKTELISIPPLKIR